MSKAFQFQIIILAMLAQTISHCNFSFGQTNTDKQLALEYYQNQEYDKAAILYESLFEKSQLDYYYNFYLNCLLKLEDYKKAGNLVKKQIKRNPENLGYLVDFGYVYYSSGDNVKSRQQYDKAIKLLPPDMEQVILLANAFLAKSVDDYCIETYLKGRRLLKDNYTFYLELAGVYSKIGNLEAMITEYLDLLHEMPSQKGQVQNLLQARIFEEENSKNTELLNDLLLKRTQKFPSEIIYPEMLIWHYVQVHQFDAAFIQAKSLDKRQKEEGARLIDLGKLCVENNSFDAGIKCFQYVIDKGKTSYLYSIARMELLNALKIKITSSDYTRDDLVELEENYQSGIDEFGKSQNTLSLIRGLSYLKAFYLNDPDGAISLLKEVVSLPRLSDREGAECKLELADILLLKGETWDASLFYSQVDKAFKNDPLGHEAKFRNAKLFYFKGEFDWAHSQLDVLKASTSKLIANDAMELSLLISDNTILDTSTTALLLFAGAELLAFQNKDEQAIAVLDSIIIMFPGHSLTDECYMKNAEILIKKRNYRGAAEYLSKIVSDFPHDILGDDALFKLAELFETKLVETTKAMELYQQLLVNYSGSIYAVDARKKLRRLRGDKLN